MKYYNNIKNTKGGKVGIKDILKSTFKTNAKLEMEYIKRKDHEYLGVISWGVKLFKKLVKKISPNGTIYKVTKNVSDELNRAKDENKNKSHLEVVNNSISKEIQLEAEHVKYITGKSEAEREDGGVNIKEEKSNSHVERENNRRKNKTKNKQVCSYYEFI